MVHTYVNKASAVSPIPDVYCLWIVECYDQIWGYEGFIVVNKQLKLFLTKGDEAKEDKGRASAV